MTTRIVALVTDAFGGRGGIAAYNRNFLKALCSYPGVDEVVALPRSVPYALEAMPGNLRFDTTSAGSKLRYARAVGSLLASLDGCTLVTCGHLHLLPFAHSLGLRFGCPVLPLCYGLEAWRPTSHAVANALCRRLEAFVSIRKLTANRLREWAGIPDARFYYLPNCIDLASFGAAPKSAELIARYRLQGRTVVMTAGRLDDSPLERNKGFDEVLEALPELVRAVPGVVYLIMGDGNDQPRFEEKAKALGVADRVIFTGYVPEAEKADHYRLADVVAMPGSNPIFDRYPYRFAFLEPLACGVPVVGSRLEDAGERDDNDAERLIIQVDPHDSADIVRGIREALAQRGRGVSPVLHKFSYGAFERTAHAIIADVLEQSRHATKGAIGGLRKTAGL